MAGQDYRFQDGAAYERMMGVWSRLAGEVFLDWLAPRPGLRWIDVGCGSGAFTELLFERCAAADVQGVDPSDGQLRFARTRAGARKATFRQGDAMALPFADDSFDAAAMALVLFFVPNPAKGVAEMTRVVRPGGLISSYSWDMLGGGFPMEPILVELRAMGVTHPPPPSAAASRMEALRELWMGAGLDAIETREITVQRTFTDFDEFWTASMGSNIGRTVAGMNVGDAERLKARVRSQQLTDAVGHITFSARANAIKGRVPQ